MAIEVTFRNSGKKAAWNDRYENLLDMAEENGIVIENAYRQGICGTCKTKLLSGEVHMDTTDGLDEGDINEQLILPCVAAPKTDVVIEA